MGKPAARSGDMTAHGGVIVAGCPTVLIGGMPAARQGDMHTCPIPGAPPPPHVGGPITLGSPTVLIGGMMAARVGDMCTCTGPPDSIIPPGCPTVLIGEAGSGSAGGGAGGGGGGGSGQGEAGDGAVATAESDAEAEEHFFHVDVVDSAGLPIAGPSYTVSRSGEVLLAGALTGTIRTTSLAPGDYDLALKAITAAAWSAEEANVGDQLTLTAECAGIEDGTEAVFVVMVRDFNTGDKPVATVTAEVSGDRIEADWTHQVQEEQLPPVNEQTGVSRLSSPTYYFLVHAGGCSARSGILRLLDVVEISLRDDEGNAIGDRPYQLRLADGTIREGTLDGEGQAREDRVPPGRVRVSFNVREQP